jgi:hypothetical protein
MVKRTSRSVQRRRAVQSKPKRHKLLAEEPYGLEDGVTYSLQSTFGDCRERCRLELAGWRSTHLKESLQFGSLTHTLLERLGKAVIAGTARDADDAVAVLSTYEDEWRTQQHAAHPSDLQQSEFVLAKAQAVWPEYVVYYEEDLDPKRWVELEGKFDVEWESYRLRGRRDGMLRRKGALWLFETKTKGQIVDEDIMDLLEFNPQALFYMLANQIELERRGIKSEKGLVGVIYNVIRSPGERLLKKGAEPLADYRARVQAKIAGNPDHYFKRYEAMYTKKQLQAFAARLATKIDAFAEWVCGDGQHYRNDGEGGACTKKWKCSFIKACATGRMDGFERTGRLFEELED